MQRCLMMPFDDVAANGNTAAISDMAAISDVVLFNDGDLS